MTEELSELRAELALTIDARDEAIKERDEARAERDRMAKDLGDLRQHMATAVVTTAGAFNRYAQIEALAMKLIDALDSCEEDTCNEGDLTAVLIPIFAELYPLLKRSPAPPTSVDPK